MIDQNLDRTKHTNIIVRPKKDEKIASNAEKEIAFQAHGWWSRSVAKI